ncbi:MAG: hypothetical protein ACTICX_04495, partial [Lactobacillus helveticus]
NLSSSLTKSVQFIIAICVNIILNNNSINNWIENTIIELGWILILYIALLEVVKKGLKKYADIMG